MPWTGLILHNEGSPFNIMSRNLPEKIYSQIQRYWVQTLIDKILVTIAIAFLSNGTLGLTKKIVWQFLSMPLRSRSKRCLKNFTRKHRVNSFPKMPKLCFGFWTQTGEQLSSTTDTTSIRQPSLHQPSLHQPWVGQQCQFVNYVSSSTTKELRQLVNSWYF